MAAKLTKMGYLPVQIASVKVLPDHWRKKLEQ
jgi:hypothetical protein